MQGTAVFVLDGREMRESRCAAPYPHYKEANP